MSIFKSTFTEAVKNQLKVRQNAMTNRTPSNLQYLNSRNAWIRMVSSVDVSGDKGALARKYVLQGGTLNDTKGIGTAFTGSLKSGVGSDFSKAYSNKSQAGAAYQRGIRPMPGITGIEVKSLSAYGSLRETIVNFQCWDIQQLEDLEVLYMRPGYTVLVEWGWTPYLDNNGNYQSNFFDYYDILNKPPTDRTTLFRELYQKSVKYGGNYDAMFGYVKNYQWSARMDGGYDCQTTVISTGEIIESLKVNYISSTSTPTLAQIQAANAINAQGQPVFVAPLAPTPQPTPPPTLNVSWNNNALNPMSVVSPTTKTITQSSTGQPLSTPVTITSVPPSSALLQDEFTGGTIPDTPSWKTDYEKNLLAGMWSEVFYRSIGPQKADTFNISKSSSAFFEEYMQAFTNLYLTSNTNEQNTLSGNTGNQVYITLGAVLNFLNKYIIAKGSDGQPLVRLSLKSNEYDGSPVTDLLCIAHPLQVSVDPGVCLIKSPIWSGGTVIQTVASSAAADTNLQIAQTAYESISKAIKESEPLTFFALIKDGVNSISNLEIYSSVESLLKEKNKTSLQEILNNKISGRGGSIDIINEIQSQLKRAGIQLNYQSDSITRVYVGGSSTSNVVKDKSIIINSASTTSTTAVSQVTITQKSGQALSNVAFLKDLKKNYFYDNEYGYTEIGIIKNIYVNVDYLYKQALSTGLEASDTKEKNEINLYNYLKKVISDIQTSIGNINNFEIHVDPVDNNVARIIDVNYTEATKATYENLFELQVHNLNSIVRSYSLQSQIFPNQSAAIAIGSQAKGGQLGMQTNTFIDFNRNLVDRIIPEKLDGLGNLAPSVKDNKPTITNGLAQIILAFSSFSEAAKADSTENKVDKSTLFSNAKNSLRDVIAYFQSITKAPGSNRNLIPTKFSCELDGIGGFVIGHMFRLPDNIMPRGYRGVGIGSKLGNAITSIGHTISNGDWVTKIDTLNIVLNDYANAEGISFSYLDLNTISEIVAAAGAGNSSTGNKAPTTTGGNQNWMQQSGNAVFNKNKGVNSYCARYTYAIARGYTVASRGQYSPDGNLGLNGVIGVGVGNANTQQYRNNLIALGYKQIYSGTMTRDELINKIKGPWAIGDIINYRSLIPVKEGYAHTIGHTQIYTGAVLDVGGKSGGGSNNIPWASSWANNHGVDFVYGHVNNSTSWEVFIFSIQ